MPEYTHVYSAAMVINLDGLLAKFRVYAFQANIFEILYLKENIFERKHNLHSLLKRIFKNVKML